MMKFSIKKKKGKKLIAFDQQSTYLAEQFRIIRTNLQFLTEKRKIKHLMISSSAPGEGKSVIIGNLAAFFAQQGKKVLLVDGDLRRPTQHRIFNLQNYYGFGDFSQSQKADYHSAIQKTSIGNLDVLVSGIVPYSPTELLANFDFDAFFKEMDQKYDYIFFDAPPAIIADTAILAGKIQGVIIAVALRSIKNSKLKQTVKTLKMTGTNIVGIVCNNAKESQRDNYYYYQPMGKKK